MDKDQEVLAISKLVFELTLAGGTDSDLDGLLVRLLEVFKGLPAIRVLPRAVILLLNPRGRFVQVAQHGVPPPWVEGSSLESLPLEPQSQAHTVMTGNERYFALPLPGDDKLIGIALLGMEQDWQPDVFEVEFMTDLGIALSGLVNRCVVMETLRVREIELEDARTDAIRRLGAASEYRDNETGLHVMRMTNYAGAIAKALGLSESQRERLSIAAPMHDVGKIGIADAILLKPSRLTDEEFSVMMTHTEIGERILRGSDALIEAAREIAVSHHESWDGSGYPKGLKGEEIPVFARICAIADVFDALTSHRPYKEAWPVNEAIQWIHGQAGKKFDPVVVDAFDQALPQILRIRELYRDDIINPNQVLTLPELPSRERGWVIWDDSLSIGIDTIDAHHHYLFDLTNDLFDSVVQKLGAKEVVRVLKTLDQYAQVHFQAEERMMEHYGYPALDNQKLQHHGFREKLKELYDELHINPLTAQFDVLNFLKKWLVGHIWYEDAKLRHLVTVPGTA
ncbi:bacteriohemerythrin [Denitratisoma oestradiolicum]|uniref:Uncharacterized protein n=1 Tax=Denitratisoma oestradiolicum TaxID=311182 RepID=A0A6S6XY57_9PROT|nr:bacteriohemerythrin [Denitratisoma oestradiolicum]TWO80208.1 hypothetical protein CBW56_10330 [Denitratisoma oestradiolicum]CAB1369287.1 conserved protein of unknown function [Denitratisoma oestradiolicum]